MIKNILYVEDGSVDIDDLEENLGNETKVIIYRQGSAPPILVQPKEPIKDIYDDYVERTIKRLAELEDKIENGTIIELPCKVGTIVYQIYKDCSKCSHFKETGWEYDCWCDFDSEESKTMFEFDGDNDCVYIIEETEFTYNHIKDFGKDIFLTKAEAEKKLEE